MPAHSPQLAKRYQQTLDNLKAYAGKYKRPCSSINLIAVSKRHSAGDVLRLLQLGHQDFAENYLQEGLLKIQEIRLSCHVLGMEDSTIWHFIGHIQRNKCRRIAASFQWVHTVDSQKVAEKLNQYRQDSVPLNVLIQVNLQQEPAKSGVCVDDLPELAESIHRLPNLKLRGLMIIPKYQTDLARQRSVFRQCRLLFDQLNQQGLEIDHLSMGMTQDMEAAIAEGATQIRIGTAIFGQRPD